METIVHKQKYTFLMTLIVFIFNLCLFISPAKAAVHESSNVFDQAGVMDQKSINKIDRINAENLAKIKGHPQIAVMTVNETDSIEEYAQDQFDKYKFGHAGYDNGVLVVFAIKNRQFRIQIGYGVENIITDTWAGSDAVDGEPKEELRAGEYGQAAVTITKRIAKKLANNTGDIKTKEQITAVRKQEKKNRAAAERNLMSLISLISATGILALIMAHAMLLRRKKYFKKVENTTVGKKYKLTVRSLLDVNTDLATYLYDEISDPNKAAEFLVLDQKLRSAKNSKVYDEITNTQIKKIIESSKLDDVLKRLDNLDKAKDSNEFNTKFVETNIPIYTKTLNKLRDEKEINPKNYQKLLEKLEDFIEKNKKKSRKLESKFVSAYLANKFFDFDKEFKDYESIWEQRFENWIKNEDVQLMLKHIRNSKELSAVLNDLGDRYSLEDGYDHLSEKQKKIFAQKINQGSNAADVFAAAMIINALTQMQTSALIQMQIEDMQRRNYSSSTSSSNNFNDNDFGGGSFGGFGGSSGGGGATSSW